MLANDFDPDGDPLTLVSVDSPSYGTAEILSSKIVYTAHSGYAGTDSFVYTISDGNNTNTARVNITVYPAGTPRPNAICGDANADDSTDILDALIIAQYYVGIAFGIKDYWAADFNCSKSIDIIDALMAAQYYVGLLANGYCCTAE